MIHPVVGQVHVQAALICQRPLAPPKSLTINGVRIERLNTIESDHHCGLGDVYEGLWCSGWNTQQHESLPVCLQRPSD